MKLQIQEAYNTIFKEYPDVIDVEQMCRMLGGISAKTGYRLLRSGEIKGFSIGRRYRIPKLSVLEYMNLIDKSSA